jgi:hypothetical protein
MVASHQDRAPQHRRWLQSAWDGITTPGMATQGRRWRRAPLALCHKVIPNECQVGGRTPLEGVAAPFRGVRHGGRAGVGTTVPRNDTGHPA